MGSLAQAYSSEKMVTINDINSPHHLFITYYHILHNTLNSLQQSFKQVFTFTVIRFAVNEANVFFYVFIHLQSKYLKSELSRKLSKRTLNV